MVKWLRSFLAEQKVRGSIPGLAATISEIGYRLLPIRDMTKINTALATLIPNTTSQPTCHQTCHGNCREPSEHDRDLSAEI